MIVWDETYSVGVEVLDNDHKVMMGLINQLLELSEANAGRVGLEPVFDVLMDYVVSHFGREEAMMEEAGCADLDRHRAAHKRLRQGVETFHAQFRSQPDENIVPDLCAYLETWWRVHILDEDKRYKSALAAAPPRLT